MIKTTRRTRLAVASLGLALAGASAYVLPTFAQDAMEHGDMQDKMGGKMGDDMMMKDQMAKMKTAMSDETGKMQMTQDLAKTIVMERMAMKMCMSDAGKKMMSEDAGMQKMVADAEKMAADPEKMKMMQSEIAADPTANRQLMLMAMAHSAMMKDHMDRDKMGGDKMEGKMGEDKMEADKMK